MQRFTIAVIWMTGPAAGTIGVVAKTSTDLETLEFICPVGSTWSEEGGHTYRVVALPACADTYSAEPL